MQIFCIINTGKESGISLQNSLGCDNVYTLISLKRVMQKSLATKRCLEALKIMTEQTPLAEMQSLSEK